MSDFYGNIYNEMYRNGYKRDKNASIANDLCSLILGRKELGFKSVLDAGCGNGAAVEYMQLKGKKAFGFDVSTEAIKLAHSMGRKSCVAASVLSLPFDDNSFDLIMSADMFEHLKTEDVPLALSEIRRVSKKHQAVKVATKLSGDKPQYINIKDFDIPNLHLTVKDMEWWLAEFNKAGFRDVKIKGSVIFSRK